MTALSDAEQAEARRICGARPVEGSARCDQDPADCAAGGHHSAPLRIGGRVTFRKDHRMSFELHTDDTA